MKLRVSDRSFAYFLLVVVTSLAALCLPAQAQTWTQYDQGTPPQHAAGVSPLGSYMSTDLGTVNLSNGALNLKLPLGAAGGRGFEIPITLNFSSKVWSVAHDNTIYHGNDVSMAYASYGAEDAYHDIYQRLAPGWTISGVPLLKRQFDGITGCVNGYYIYYLTKLTVVLPDKGEIELRDDLADGAPLYSNCSSTFTEYRGRRWHATDGSGTIFISDNDNGIVTGDLVGTLVTSDGMRYRFQNTTQFGGGGTVLLGRCTSITDRHGNQIVINYVIDPNNQNHIETDYIDQLGRTTKVEENAPDPANPAVTLPLLVTIKGYQGATQYYKVKTDLLGQHIRADFNYNQALPIVTGSNDRFGYCYGGGQPPPSVQLFSGSYCGFQERIDNQNQVTEVDLPDGRSLRFNYNTYGELAEVLLPTGGKLQYDYTGVSSGIPSGNSLSFEYQGQYNLVNLIDRVINARRTYPDGATLEGTWAYSYGPQLVNGTSYACTELKCYAGTITGTLLLDQRHFFLTASRYLTGNIGGAGFGTGYSLWSTGIEWRTETLNTSGGVINAAEQDWAQRAAVSWSSGYTQEQPANDNRVSEGRHLLDDGSVVKVDTYYDTTNYPQANNVAEVREYDFDASLKRRTTTTYVTGSYQTDDTIHLLRLPTQQSVYDAGGTERARAVYEYDNYSNDGNHAALQDYGAVTGHDATYGASKTTRGNPTRIGRWLSASNTTLYSYPRYDTLGNAVSNKDANGNVATISYTDDFGIGSNPGAGSGGTYGATYALPTLLTSPPPNSGEAAQTARSQYDFSTGLLTGFKDRNGVIAQTIYNDPLNRPTLTKSALNQTGVETHTAIYYAPATVFGLTLANNDVLAAKDQAALDDANLRSWTKTDGFGRVFENWTHDPLGDAKVTTIYDALGRVSQKSNPYRPSAGETPIYNTTAYDLAGRVISVATPDNATVATAYSGAKVLVTDQAGKQRLSQTNALGQLTDVWEIRSADSATESVSFPGHTEVTAGYRSKYVYDTLSNLTTVTQQIGTSGTTQTRSFAYDSLKQLTSVTNPESGAVTYQYDNNGNLTQKTDARSISTTINYDALNRVKTKTYSDSTPAINYFYDNQTLPTGAPSYSRGSSIGRMVAVTYSGGSVGNYYGYDVLGRATVKYQRISTTNYQVQAGYNLASEMTSETYPSGRTVSYSYDVAGRLSTFSGTLGDGLSRTYASITQYNAAGLKERESYGTGAYGMTKPLYLKLHYNHRMQMVDLRLGSVNDEWNWNRGALIFYYGSNAVSYWNPFQDDTDNNGNVRRALHYVPTAVDGNDINITSYVIPELQDYTYDSLNRIGSVTEAQQDASGNWAFNVDSQTFGYDRYGNRGITVATGGVNNYNPAYDQTTNRINGQTYDAVGNETSYNGGYTLTYDAENRQVSANGTGGSGSYVYDGEGKRVKRITSGQEWWYIYGLGGELLEEYLSTAPTTVKKQYGYWGGQLLVVWDSAQSGDQAWKWLVTDHLGSTRMESDKSGSLTGMKRHDYLPFGEELTASVGAQRSVAGVNYEPPASNIRQKFTGKERDGETGLDFFGARYYSSVQGRFTSVDPSQQSVSLINPQSFNRYSYVLNNPLAYIDHNGKWPTAIHELIIDRAFRGLPDYKREILKRASGIVDGITNGGQSQKSSYKHGMRAPNESIKEAAGLAADFIRSNQFTARNEYNLDNIVRHMPGFSEKALLAFGTALHTVTDMTSPAHEGFQVWNGLPIPGTSSFVFDAAAAITHNDAEAQISPGRLGLAIGASLKLFEDAFGAAALKEATGGVVFGSKNDPSVEAIHAQYSLPGSNPKAEGEALYEYRLGLQRGLNFNWNQQ